MRIPSVLIAAVICSSLLNTATAQRRSGSRIADVRISKNHPTVYVTFERAGKRESRRHGESSEGVWLRLHNNTRWRIDLQAYGLSNIFIEGNEKEVGFYYEVAAIPKPSSRFREIPPSPVAEEQECKLPVVGYGDLRSGIELAPGESILFSVPREHLCKNLYVKLDFRYAWQPQWGDEPLHSVRFYGLDVPDEAR